MSLRIRTHIRIMVDMQARMFRFPLDEVGEAMAIITITDTMADIAMAGMGGIHDGIGERGPVLKKL